MSKEIFGVRLHKFYELFIVIEVEEKCMLSKYILLPTSCYIWRNTFIFRKPPSSLFLSERNKIFFVDHDIPTSTRSWTLVWLIVHLSYHLHLQAITKELRKISKQKCLRRHWIVLVYIGIYLSTRVQKTDYYKKVARKQISIT